MYQLGAMQGWQCPLCKRIYGPFIQECLHCNNPHSTLTTTTTGDDPEEMNTITNPKKKITTDGIDKSITIDWTKHESTTWDKHIPHIY